MRLMTPTSIINSSSCSSV